MITNSKAGFKAAHREIHGTIVLSTSKQLEERTVHDHIDLEGKEGIIARLESRK